MDVGFGFVSNGLSCFGKMTKLVVVCALALLLQVRPIRAEQHFTNGEFHSGTVVDHLADGAGDPDEGDGASGDPDGGDGARTPECRSTSASWLSKCMHILLRWNHPQLIREHGPQT